METVPPLRLCFTTMCDDALNQSSWEATATDHINIDKISYHLAMYLLQGTVCLYFMTPFLFRYSLWIRRHILFTHSVSLNFFRRADYYLPEAHGIQGGRNFQIRSRNSKSKFFELGCWHILPKSLVFGWENKSIQSWNDALRSSGKPILLYFHGSIGTRAAGPRCKLYKLLQNLDYHVISFDYRGFGDSTCVLPSETRTVADGLTVYTWLRETLGKDSTVPIFFWGHSMGSGISCHLTADLTADSDCTEGLVMPKGLILEAPFTNMKEEIRVYFVAYIFNMIPSVFDWFYVEPLDKTDMLFENDRHILNIKMPILILHANNDAVVPYPLGRKLYNIARKARAGRGGYPVHFRRFTGFWLNCRRDLPHMAQGILLVWLFCKDSCAVMGVPFDFPCYGGGVYMCSRCGFDLFSSDDKVQQSGSARPNFTKAISLNAILKVAVSDSTDAFKIICGKCKVPIGNEYQTQNTPGGKLYNVNFQSLHFVPNKRCSVPLSFLF